MNQNKRFRILSIYPSTYGFGYAVMEGGNALIDSGKKVINKNKSVGSLRHIEKAIIRNTPDVLVLQVVEEKGTYRAPRIKELHGEIVALAKERKLEVREIGTKETRLALLGDAKGTKYEIAQMLAGKFPGELADRLPPKRKLWKSEDSRMDIFEAVALVVTQFMKMN